VTGTSQGSSCRLSARVDPASQPNPPPPFSSPLLVATAQQQNAVGPGRRSWRGSHSCTMVLTHHPSPPLNWLQKRHWAANHYKYQPQHLLQNKTSISLLLEANEWSTGSRVSTSTELIGVTDEIRIPDFPASVTTLQSPLTYITFVFLTCF